MPVALTGEGALKTILASRDKRFLASGSRLEGWMPLSSIRLIPEVSWDLNSSTSPSGLVLPINNPSTPFMHSFLPVDAVSLHPRSLDKLDVVDAGQAAPATPQFWEQRPIFCARCDVVKELHGVKSIATVVAARRTICRRFEPCVDPLLLILSRFRRGGLDRAVTETI
jgi:hypothetical protein